MWLVRHQHAAQPDQMDRWSQDRRLILLLFAQAHSGHEDLVYYTWFASHYDHTELIWDLSCQSVPLTILLGVFHCTNQSPGPLPNESCHHSLHFRIRQLQCRRGSSRFHHRTLWQTLMCIIFSSSIDFVPFTTYHLCTRALCNVCLLIHSFGLTASHHLNLWDKFDRSALLEITVQKTNDASVNLVDEWDKGGGESEWIEAIIWVHLGQNRRRCRIGSDLARVHCIFTNP